MKPLAAALRYADKGWRVFPVHAMRDGRCDCGKATCPAPGKHPRTPHGLLDATTEKEVIESWWAEWPTANVAIATGKVSGILLIDVDDPASFRCLIEELGEPRHTIEARTGGGGLHLVFEHPDKPIRSRNGVLAPGVDIKGEGGYIVAPPSLHKSGERYSWIDTGITAPERLPESWLERLYSLDDPAPPPAAGGNSSSVPRGSRNSHLTSLGGSMRRRGMSGEAILAALIVENRERRDPPLDEAEVGKIATSVSKYPPAEAPDVGPPDEDMKTAVWPSLGAFALEGLAGRAVEAATMHSESDPAAVLFSLLTHFSACVGSVPYFCVGDTLHSARLFAVVVGNSATARKGTSVNSTKKIISQACLIACQHSPDNWAPVTKKGPLSTGEGLIFEVRDEIRDREDKVIDEGVTDKRLFVIEEEFGNVLKVMQREGNTLSPTLRHAWDIRNDVLAPMTKTNRVQATAPHIAVLGHITVPELRANLSAVDLYNGMANRFLWVCARRGKVVPFPEPIPDDVLQGVAGEFADALIAARDISDMAMNTHAQEQWRDEYPTLTRDREGPIGAVAARGPAQVLRLAMVYALLGQRAVINDLDLHCALAAWQYSLASAEYIFGDSTGDNRADKILAALMDQGKMTQTEISALFNRHLSADKLRDVLQFLESSGRIANTETTDNRRKTIHWALRNAN